MITLEWIRARCRIDEGGCWLWRGYIRPDGYVRERYGGKQYYVHRAAWRAKHGEAKGFVIHTCGVKHCMNPRHMVVGGPRERVINEMRLKGDSYKANRRLRTTAANRAKGKLTMDKANRIREEVAGGKSRAAVARKYEVSPQHVCRIVSLKAWVPDILRSVLGF